MLINKWKIVKLLGRLLLFIVLLTPVKSAAFASDSYAPFPIVFVHGINSNEIETWDFTKSELEKYFKDQNGYKYFHNDRQDYFPDCNYQFMNNGDIRSIAWVLKLSIDNAIKDLPDGQKKVIIVAHSMGGLVVRSLLKQLPDYQSKIDRVIFIGTPHLGAPAASALWILKELNKNTDLVTKYSRFYSASAFSGFKYKPIKFSPYVFARMASRITALKANIALLLKVADATGPDPSGIALEELRLAGDVNYHATLTDFTISPFIKEDISLGHSVNDTFLGQNNLAKPIKYKTIRGVNDFNGKILAWGIDELIDNFNDNFSFPQGQSLLDAKNTGDGIVSKASQEGLGSADYTVNAFHTSMPLLGISGEPNAYQTILLALEDAPEIESVRAVPVDWGKRNNEHYIIIKVKDYLLADIEIEEIKLDDTPITLPDNFKGADGKYKPYNAFGKEFLKSREDTSAPYRDMSGNMTNLNLQQGEFWVKLDLTGKNTMTIKVKNPAAAFDASKYTVERIMVLSHSTLTPKRFGSNGPIDGGLHWWPISWYGGAPATNYYLDIPPFDQSKPIYDHDGNVFYYDLYPEHLTLSFEIDYSLFSNIKFSLFTCVYDREYTEDKIIKRLIVERIEELNLIGGTEEQSVYGKSFGNIIGWDGKDDNGTYAYTSKIKKINWTNLYHFCYGGINDILVIEPIDDDPEDNLLPLTFSYTESLFLEK